jgi:Beta-fructosidases (levanase/invertase)
LNRNFISIILLFSIQIVDAQADNSYSELYRPQIHFSPPAHWMNDPNGLLFYQDHYHLFYQYYPDSIVWGPMHWGHAISSDMVQWKNLPIALYPDRLGYIFSGSAVVDSGNTTGFGKNGNIPLIAIFTSHDPKGEKAGRLDFQNQSLAYSLDAGLTWKKYGHNPVLKNPGIKDFRDPKVTWYAAAKKWIMTLATHDRITFYSSKNLIRWTKESEFGNTIGAHGGVWECPDLFPLFDHDKKIWVLLVSINPGGPNGGSATQYFIGDFDGHVFTPFQTDTRWIDYGPDDYAGVTWSNTGNRKIFLGWMSNWLYGTTVPTKKWRSAMTVPRELTLLNKKGSYYLQSQVVKELNSINGKGLKFYDLISNDFDISQRTGLMDGPGELRITMDQIKDYSIVLSNGHDEKVVLGFEKSGNRFYIDRTHSGNINFSPTFPGRFYAPRISDKSSTDIEIIIDKASVELFADGGLSVMTAIFFPTETFTKLEFKSPGQVMLKTLQYRKMKSIWK